MPESTSTQESDISPLPEVEMGKSRTPIPISSHPDAVDISPENVDPESVISVHIISPVCVSSGISTTVQSASVREKEINTLSFCVPE